MPYTQYDRTKPDAATQNGTQVLASVRDNLQAVRDMIALGSPIGWDYSKSNGSGTAAKPQFIFYKRSTEWIRGTLTWGASGGSLDSVTVALYEYSSDTGTTWSVIGTKALAYDASGNLTTATWS